MYSVCWGKALRGGRHWLLQSMALSVRCVGSVGRLPWLQATIATFSSPHQRVLEREVCTQSKSCAVQHHLSSSFRQLDLPYSCFYFNFSAIWMALVEGEQTESRQVKCGYIQYNFMLLSTTYADMTKKKGRCLICYTFSSCTHQINQSKNLFDSHVDYVPIIAKPA